jgi:CheY-like chemotaxis protein
LMKPVRRSALFEAIANAMSKHDGTAAAPAVDAPAVVERPALDQCALRVLLVDDSRDNRLLMQAYLKNIYSNVEEAENGAIAVDKVKSGKYDLVLMDIQMPVMDGLEAMRRIRQWEKDGARERTRIIALTASALESDVRRCLEAGADLHLSKPIKKRVLLTAMHAPILDSAARAAV